MRILDFLISTPGRVVLVLGLVAILHAQVLAQTSDDSKWISLFDGQSIEGWVKRGGNANYRVEDGAIVGTTVPNTANTFLCTPKDYSDFQLELDFKVHPHLNSGVQIRSLSKSDYRKGRVHGYQVEIDPSSRSYSAGIYDEARRGWLNDLSRNRAARFAFKQNEWNTLRVEAIGNRIRTWLNDVPAADLTDDLTATGFIALQVHGVGGRKDPIDVRWRNIRIRETSQRWPENTTDPSKVEEVPFIATSLRKISDGYRFVEGPAVGPNGKIYFNDIPNNKTHIYDPNTDQVTVFRENSGGANGLFWTPNDRLISCEGKNRRVSILRNGKYFKMVDQFDGKKLNSPNDLVLDQWGGLFFTDPRYGNRDDMEMSIEGVYYFPRNGREVQRVCDDLVRPNGLVLSPDDKTLYVADTAQSKIFAFDVSKGKLSKKRQFASIGSDGMSIDRAGHVYCTFGNAVIAFSPDGTEAGRLKMPEKPANCLVVGQKMYITARKGFYVVNMNYQGLAY